MTVRVVRLEPESVIAFYWICCLTQVPCGRASWRSGFHR